MALADAWATALTAMPYEKALRVATQQNVAALFVILADGVKADATTGSIDDWQMIQTPAMQVLRADKKP